MESTRVYWSTDDHTGEFTCLDGFYASSVGASAELFDNEEDARRDFERRVESLPERWKVEHDCSKGRWNGGWAATLERNVEEYDEDSDEWYVVESETVARKVWDGEGWCE